LALASASAPAARFVPAVKVFEPERVAVPEPSLVKDPPLLVRLLVREMACPLESTAYC
jgi:hypothetical protein